MASGLRAAILGLVLATGPLVVAAEEALAEIVARIVDEEHVDAGLRVQDLDGAES